MVFSAAQEKAINERGKNMLVSASAGSGKTGVLVERIVRLVVQENVSIDKMLIMTFTKNAAAEMRSRIKARLIEILNEKISNGEDTDNIEYQISLMNNANIQTIDSFCKELVDKYFTRIDYIDPKYRIADEKELIMLRDDVATELLEGKYDKKEYKDFFKLYFKKDDKSIKYMLDRGLFHIYCKPFPYDYIEDLKNTWKEKNERAKEDYYNYILNNARNDIAKKVNELDESAKLLDNVSYKTEKKDDINRINNNIERINDYIYDLKKDFVDVDDDTLVQNIKGCKNFQPLVFIYKKGDDEPMPLTNGNTSIGATLNKEDGSDKIYKIFYYKYKDFALGDKSYLSILSNIFINYDNMDDKQINNPYELMYLDMLSEYYKKYEEAKKDKNIISIEDLQKIALDLLYDYNDKNNQEYSNIAKELSEYYDYIFVDEYQDTSLIQEKILEAITLGFKNKNLFMVGDIKQSIYRFRNADVSIFKEKFEKYKEDSKNPKSDNILIELNENYRSSDEVVRTVNNIFEDIMTEESGDIEYKKDSMLIYGRIKKEKDIYDDMDRRTKIFLASGIDIKKEADVVADIVEKLHDKENIPYRDMTILLRKEKNTFKYYMDSLEKRDIPAYCEMSSGFYDTYEIQLIIDLLSIIDNPYDDIRLCSVLTSPIYDISNNELAYLKKEYRHHVDIKKKEKFQLEKAVETFIDRYNNQEYQDKKDIQEKYDINIDILCEKIRQYLSHMSYFREKSKYESISDLINVIYDTTNIINLMRNMPGGSIRANNLKLMIEKARNYENTSYVGLYNFIRYLMRIKTEDIDEGIGKIYDEKEDIVKITTIHKSKGLQYKVVIMPNLEAQYNEKSYREGKDRSNLLCINDTYGVSLNTIDYKKKLEYVTPKRYLIDMEEELESKNEEKRILYVAMTRAEERLILIDRYRSEKKLKENYPDNINAAGEKYSTSIEDIKAAKKYKDLIYNGICNSILDDVAEKIILNNEDIENILNNDNIDDNIAKVDILDWKIKNKYELSDRFKEEILDKNLSYIDDRKIYTAIKPKVSVSSIKEESMKVEDVDLQYDTKDMVDIDNINEGTAYDMKASEVGSLYHKFMEIYDYNDNVENSLKKYVDMGYFDKNIYDLIDINKLKAFENNELCVNMKNASRNNNLYKEKRFMKYLKKGDIDKYKKINEKVAEDTDIIVQGIIDAFYIEKDEKGKPYITLIDYKTDGLKYGKISEKTLIDRYKVQLEIYRKALEDMTHMEVKNTYIYSFTLDKTISI